MRKKMLLLVFFTVTLVAIIACASPKKDKVKTKTSEQKNSVVLNDTQHLPPLPENTMKIDDVAAGDFTSLAGVWKNESGSTLVFDSEGLLSDIWQFKSGPEKKDDIIQISYGEQGKESEGYKLLIIPAETKIPSNFFAEDSDGDVSDNNRDRMVIVKDPLTTYFEVYYKLSEEEQ